MILNQDFKAGYYISIIYFLMKTDQNCWKVYLSIADDGTRLLQISLFMLT